MSNISVDYDVLNQKQTPAFYASSLATRPTFGYPGRIFIDTDSPSSGIYRDTGSAWVQVADPGAGTTGTLQQVTTNGNTTTQGISITAGGLSANTVSVIGGTSSQFLKANGTIDSTTYLQNGGYLNGQVLFGTPGSNNPGGSTSFTWDNILGRLFVGIYFPSTAVLQIGGAADISGTLTSNSLVKIGGTSSQFLKADGTVDSNTYALTSSLSNYLLLTGGSLTGTLNGTNGFFSNKMSVGTTAIPAGFSNTLFYAGLASPSETHIYQIGVTGTATANSSDANIWGVGVYGAGFTNGGTRSAGVQGDGEVTASSDTGSAIGVRGYATATHAGGLNIGMLSDASGSSTGNYGYYTNMASSANTYANYHVGTAASYFGGSLTANSLVKIGGTSSQFLKADGTVDSSTYALTSSLSNYLLLTGGTLTGGLIGTNASFISDSSSYSFKVYTNISNSITAINIGGSSAINGIAAGWSAAATIATVAKDTGSGRSINAAGSLNASGADYAEYMYKDIIDIIEKGDICGVNINGNLTNVFNDSISFVVKSTNPSYVGNDIWAIESIVGKIPIEDNYTDKEQFNLDLIKFKDKVELERQKVDRIAFCGQVPCNVYNANVGDYIIPINDNNKIVGQAIKNPTFDQYQKCIGKVWKILENGKAWISIKIS